MKNKNINDIHASLLIKKLKQLILKLMLLMNHKKKYTKIKKF